MVGEQEGEADIGTLVRESSVGLSPVPDSPSDDLATWASLCPPHLGRVLKRMFSTGHLQGSVPRTHLR
eukprot:3149251-Alexandrium_andersonii.AAC.1